MRQEENFFPTKNTVPYRIVKTFMMCKFNNKTKQFTSRVMKYLIKPNWNNNSRSVLPNIRPANIFCSLIKPLSLLSHFA